MEKKERKDALRQYQRYLKLQKGFTPNTLDAYLRDVQKLLLYLKGEGIDPLEVKLEDLEHFSASLHDLGIAPSSQARILCGVRSFYRFLSLDGWIEQDPAELLESPKQGEHLPEYLSTAEVDQLEAIIDVSKWEGHRNRAIIEVLFSCGLRVSELVNLPLSNLYLDEGFIRVFGKGRKERLVPISPKAIKELNLWFAVRRHMTIKPGEEDYVFLNRRGSHLTRTMILIMTFRKPSLPIPSAIPLLRLCWKVVLTSVPFRRCWVMSPSAPQKSIPILIRPPSVRRFFYIIRGTSKMKDEGLKIKD